MAEERFTVQFAKSTVGGNLTTQSFMKVKAHQVVRIQVKRSGERSYTDAMLTATKDAYKEGKVRIIEGTMVHPRLTGLVTLKFYEQFNNATLMPRES